jgi:aspartyl-tRNA(Asn)/glutamyl-tRNA(Gln) amidotransferase subunit C
VTQDDPGDPALTRDDVAKVAKLALLDLTDDELDRFTGQLGVVLDRARDLQAFDVDDVPPTAHPYPLVNVFRPDEVDTSTQVRDEALAAAPAAEDGLYKVPPALGEAP